MANRLQPTICARQNRDRPFHQARTEPADPTGEFKVKIDGSGAFRGQLRISRRSKGHLPTAGKRRPAPAPSRFTDFPAGFTEWRSPRPCNRTKRMTYRRGGYVTRRPNGRAGMASINYVVGDNWGSGFIGNMAVPGGDLGLHGWTVEFDASFAISDIWGAEIVSHVGNHYVVRNLDWNSNVPAGGQASFGFQATPGAGGTA